MEVRKQSLANLRGSDATTLAVLTQDVLGLPVGQLEATTLLDILALSEAGDQLPGQLAQDLADFRDRIFGQISDIPDGAPMSAFAEELSVVDPERAPACLRDWMAELATKSGDDGTVQAIGGLTTAWEGTAPLSVEVPATSGAAPAPEVVEAKKAPKKKKATRRLANALEEDQEEWLRGDLRVRLKKYPITGLKQSMIVAASRHQAPWETLKEAEVLALLRKMKREGILRHSAGRWMLEN